MAEAKANRIQDIPRIGFGTWKLKNDDCYKSVLYALKQGYRHIDTAQAYGNEVEVGKAVKDSGVPREELFITTKIKTGNFTRPYESVVESLKALGMDYVDLCIMHFPAQPNLPKDSKKHSEFRRNVWDALEKLQSEGKCLKIGVSNFEIRHLKEILEYGTIKPYINQFELHPVLNKKDLTKFCKDNGVIVVAYSSLATSTPLLFENANILEYTKKYKKSVAQILLKWALQNDFCIIPKSKTESRILENKDLLDFKLSDDEMKYLNELGDKERLVTCWDPTDYM